MISVIKHQRDKQIILAYLADIVLLISCLGKRLLSSPSGHSISLKVLDSREPDTTQI